MSKKSKDKLQKHVAENTKKSTPIKAITVRPATLKTKSKPKGHVAEGKQMIDPTKSSELQTEVNVKDVPNLPVKEVILLWTRADTDLSNDVGQMPYNDGDGEFMEKVKNAFLSVRYGTGPVACQFQFGCIRLEMRTPSESWRVKPLPPAAHSIILDVQHFSTPMEFSRFIDKKTREQIDNCAFDCNLKRPESFSKYSKYVKYRDTLCAKWKSFTSILHWTLFIMSILVSLICVYVKLFVAELDPQPVWIRFFLQIRNFIFECIDVFYAQFE